MKLALAATKMIEQFLHRYLKMTVSRADVLFDKEYSVDLGGERVKAMWLGPSG